MTKQNIKAYIISLLLCLSCIANAQISHGGRPVGHTVTTKATSNSTPSSIEYMPAFTSDMMTEAQTDVRNKSLTFAHRFEVNLNTTNSGQWNTLDNGQKIWKLTICSEGALSINIIFDEFDVPEGGQVFIYNEDMSHIIGAFTHENNKASGVLPTMPVKGEQVTIEYQAPLDPAYNASLSIAYVNHDYLGIIEKAGYFGDSESCENNVTCYTDSIYQALSRSVLKLIIGGSELMTGTLINNTQNDGAPYVLSAAHGYEKVDYNGEQTIFIFNYQSPLCSDDIEGTKEQSVAGGSMLAYSPNVTNESLDFVLLEMSVNPPLAYQPYYAGWNRNATAPDQAFCIHHPMGDVKKISFENDPLSIFSLVIGSFSYYAEGHWAVSRWDAGVTEGGSSGSPLFNKQGQILGGLSAGAASCSSPNNDYFFRLCKAWDTDAATDRQLAHWLAPTDSETMEISAFDPCTAYNVERQSHITSTTGLSDQYEETHGYLAGNNTRGITHFVEKFDIQEESASLLGFYFYTAAGNNNSIADISIWQGSDYPEEELYKASLLLKEWTHSSSITDGQIGGTKEKTDLDEKENFILLDSTVPFTENIFIGFKVYASDNTNPFALLVNSNSSENSAYYYDDTEWHAYNELSDYNMKTALWIEPVMQSTLPLDIETPSFNESLLYPNPVKDGVLLKLYSEDATIDGIVIVDMLGRKHSIHTITKSDNIIAIDVDHLPTGSYVLVSKQVRLLFNKIK